MLSAAESAVTHRRRYRGYVRTGGVLELLLTDTDNPRSLAFALAEARTAAENGLAGRTETRRAEALQELERMGSAGERFDVVVADPPAFAKSRRDQPVALKGYAKLARLAAALVAPGGFLFLASCSHHVAPGDFADASIWGIGRARRDARILFQGGAGPDHPVHPMLPESAYLKAMLFQLA